jgi:hypothetical protein
MTTRYYAQCTETNAEFCSGWMSAWQVFDRDVTNRGGDCVAIALCRNKATAFAIRDALNAAPEKSK